MRFFTISLFILFSINVWSQEYSYQYDQSTNPEETFVLQEDSSIYFLNLVKTNNYFEYNINLAEINKNTLRDKTISMDNKLISIRKGLRVFLWKKMLFFAEIDNYNQLLKISSKAIDGNQSKEQTKLVDIRKKEKIIQTYQFEQILYLLVVSPKEKKLKVYNIDLESFKVDQFTISLPWSAFSLLLGKSSQNTSIIDYSVPNSVFKMTRPVKFYYDKDILTITFDVKEKGPYESKTYVYTVDLKEKKHRFESIPYEKTKWSNFNAVLYNEHLYRIGSQDKLIQIEIIDLKNDSTILKSIDGRDYIKFNFQKSIAINESGYPIPESNKVFDFLIKNKICFFPEIYDGKATLYIGAAVNSSVYKTEDDHTSPNELFYNYNITSLNPSQSDGSLKDGSIFFESNISLYGKMNEVKELSLEIYPKFRELSMVVRELATDLGGKSVSIYKMDDKLFGIFYIEYEKKFIIKSLYDN